jgi:hypothetical protein
MMLVTAVVAVVAIVTVVLITVVTADIAVVVPTKLIVLVVLVLLILTVFIFPTTISRCFCWCSWLAVFLPFVRALLRGIRVVSYVAVRHGT